jgi:hypothetical protein
MLKSPGSENSGKLWLVAIMVAIPIVWVGFYIPLQPAYGIPTDCYLSTNTGQCIPLKHPVLITNGPLITTA